MTRQKPFTHKIANSYRLKLVLKRSVYLLCMVVFLSSAFGTPITYAMTKDDIKSIVENTAFYDPNADCTIDTGSTTTGSGNGKIVLIGDSLLVNDKQAGGLEKKLKAAKYTDITIDGAVSRSLGGKGQKGEPSGINAVTTNKKKIGEAGTVVIVLGTNSDNSDIDNIPQMIKDIKEINNNVGVYWVNTVNTGDPSRATGVNKGIANNSEKQNYKVIDWHKAVYKGASADETLLNVGDGGYHQSVPKGVNEHVRLIVDAVSSQSTGSGGGGAPVTGSKQDKSAAVIWNVLTSKGLTAEQTAGILGNLQAESGIEPAREQGSPSGSITKHMKIDGATGYGIAQWTYIKRQKGLHDAMIKAGKSDDTDLQVQAEYLWTELNGLFKSALAHLKKSTTVRAAAVIILLEFEAPANQGSEVQDQRTKFAENWFKKFGKYGAGGAMNSSTTCQCQESTTNQSGKPTIVIDPAHSGETTYRIDKQTGVMDAGYYNKHETEESFKVSQLLKEKLEKDDKYQVIMTKKSYKDSPSARDRTNIADNANANLAISIHYDTSFGDFGKKGQLYYQFTGGYRLTGTNDTPSSSRSQVKFNNSEVAKKSLAYAEKIKAARSKYEKSVVLTKANFDDRGGNIPPGNLPIVQLFSKTPWIYSESGGPLNSQEQEKYAQGLYDGITQAIPAGSGSSDPDCESSSGDAQAIVDWALKLAWDDNKHAGNDAKDIYIEWNKKTYPGWGDYTPCNQFVAIVMRASGADKNYELGVTNEQEFNYVKKHPEKYTKIDNITSTKNLQPGDIFFKNGGLGSGEGHTWLYVGNQKGGNMREAAYHKRPPGANNILSWYTSQSDTTAYRLK